MNKIETLKILTSLADNLDSRGFKNQANFIDNMILKLANDGALRPIGAVYKENNKFYRKFMDQSKGTLVVKEVTPEGVIISSTSTQPEQEESKTPESETSWSTTMYNTFDEIAAALLGDSSKNEKQNQAKDSKTKDDKEELINQYLKDLAEIKDKLKNLGIDLLDEATQLVVAPLTMDTVVDEPTVAVKQKKLSPGIYDEEIPDLTEVFTQKDISESDETQEKTRISDQDDVSKWLELIEE